MVQSGDPNKTVGTMAIRQSFCTQTHALLLSLSLSLSLSHTHTHTHSLQKVIKPRPLQSLQLSLIVKAALKIKKCVVHVKHTQLLSEARLVHNAHFFRVCDRK